jgi:multiple sugar transport system substrate-binding protein
MKRILTSCVATVLLLPCLWASGGGEAPVKPSGPVTLQMSWWGGDARHKGTIAAIELWNKNHPSITVQYAYSGWDGYHDKLTTQLAGGTAPDVFQYSFANTTIYGDMAVLADLTPYSRTKFGDYAEAMWQLGTYKGKKIGAPTGANAYALKFNKTLLQKLGVRLPTNDETWDSFLELCKQATRDTNGDGKKDFWGMDMIYSIPVDGLIPIYRQFGTTFWSADLKRSSIADPTAQSIWKMFKGFVDAGVCMGPTDATIPEGLDSLTSGYVACTFGPASTFSTEQAAVKDKWELDMVRIPHHVKGKSGSIAETPMLFGVYEKGKHKPEAIEFLAWFLTDLEANRAEGMIRGMYGTARLREAMKSTFGPTDLAMAKLLDVVDSENNPARQPDPANRERFEDVFGPEREKLIFGKVNLDEFFKNVQKFADPVLIE